MIGQPHRLTEMDVSRGINALAATLLGDAAEWTVLVKINQLTPPYLTLDPTQVYGPPLAKGVVANAIPSGSTSISLPGQSQAIWGAATTAVLSASGLTGPTQTGAITQIGQVYSGPTTAQLITEALPVASYDGTTLAFTTGTQNKYPAGAQIQAFSQYPGQTLSVLMPGDIIYLPLAAVEGFVLSAGGLTDTYGTDFEAPMAFADGGLAMASGMRLLAQRCRIRLVTPKGSLPNHPHYGSILHLLIGSVGLGSVRWQAAIRQCLLEEPGVSAVSGITVTRDSKGHLHIGADVQAAISAGAAQNLNLALTLPAAGIAA